MEPDNIFSSRELYDVAADVYWGYAFRKSLPEARDVVEHNINAMWSIADAAKRLRGGSLRFNPDAVRILHEQVREIILTHEYRGENINGVLYEDEISAASSPSREISDAVIKRFDLADDSDAAAAYKLTYSRNKVPVAGTLYLRSPLPAFLLLTPSEESLLAEFLPNGKSVIMVRDTNWALGFKKSLFLLVRAVTRLTPTASPFSGALTGVFQIPTCEAYDSGWYKLIPNSTCFLGRASFCDRHGALVRVSLKNKISLWHRLKKVMAI